MQCSSRNCWHSAHFKQAACHSRFGATRKIHWSCIRPPHPTQCEVVFSAKEKNNNNNNDSDNDSQLAYIYIHMYIYIFFFLFLSMQLNRWKALLGLFRLMEFVTRAGIDWTNSFSNFENVLLKDYLKGERSGRRVSSRVSSCILNKQSRVNCFLQWVVHLGFRRYFYENEWYIGKVCFHK